MSGKEVINDHQKLHQNSHSNLRQLNIDNSAQANDSEQEQTTKFSFSVRRQIKSEQEYRCAVLGIETPLEIHHKIPRAHGGKGTKENGVAVSKEVHWFLDKMAINRKIYFDEVMEMGKEYVVGYLNSTPYVQDEVTHTQRKPSSSLQVEGSKPQLGYEPAADGDD